MSVGSNLYRPFFYRIYYRVYELVTAPVFYIYCLLIGKINIVLQVGSFLAFSFLGKNFL